MTPSHIQESNSRSTYINERVTTHNVYRINRTDDKKSSVWFEHAVEYAIGDRFLRIEKQGETLPLKTGSQSETLQTDLDILESDNPVHDRIEELGQLFDSSKKADPERFLKVIKWICWVYKIKENTFIAHAKEVGVEIGPYQIVEFELTDISEADINSVEIGRVFYWTIGYVTKPNGQKIKQSIIRFRRVLPLSCDDVDVIADRAKELNNSINWE